MKRSVAALKAAVKSLRFVIEETVPPGPDRDEALALIRSAYYTGRDAIRAEAAEVDRICEGYADTLESALGGDGEDGEAEAEFDTVRFVFDDNVSDTSPVVRGTWVTVSHVVSLIVDGWAWSDILRTHPELTEDDVRGCLAYTLLHDREAA